MGTDRPTVGTNKRPSNSIGTLLAVLDEERAGGRPLIADELTPFSSPWRGANELFRVPSARTLSWQSWEFRLTTHFGVETR